MLIISNANCVNNSNKKILVDDISNDISAASPETIFKFIKNDNSLYIRYNNQWNTFKISATITNDCVYGSNNILKIGKKFLNTNYIPDNNDKIYNKTPLNDYLAFGGLFYSTISEYDTKIVLSATSSSVYFSSNIETSSLNYYDTSGSLISSFNITPNYNLKITAGNGNILISINNTYVGNISYDNSIKFDRIVIYQKPNSNIETDYFIVDGLYSGLTLSEALSFIDNSTSGITNKKRNFE